MSKKNVQLTRHRRMLKFNPSDPLFGSWFVLKLANYLPLKSKPKKLTLVYSVLSRLKRRYRIDPRFILVFLIQANRPPLWLVSYTYGKKLHKVPRPISLLKQYKKSMRWIIKATLQRPGRSLEAKLFDELVDLVERRSRVILWRRALLKEIFRYKFNAFRRRR